MEIWFESCLYLPVNVPAYYMVTHRQADSKDIQLLKMTLISYISVDVDL